MKYSLDDIKNAWEKYDKAHVMRVLKDGKWEVRPIEDSRGHIDGTRAEKVELKKVKSFPEYLEEEWTK